MKAVLGSIGALLFSAAILLAGGGLLGTLVAVSAELNNFPLIAIGFLSSAYFAGFMGGCIFTPHLVKRVGHVRVFAALSSLVAACSLSHMLFVNVASWAFLRALTGFSFAGLYMLIESWINEQSPSEKRGQVLSIYRMVDLIAVTIGQFLLNAADPKDYILFSVVAILISLAIFPISLSTSKAPMAVTSTKLNIKKLIKISPLAVAGCFAVGLSSGAFWAVAPVFVQKLGYPVLMVSIFMSVVVFSGAIMQWPIGWLSDKIGRRVVIIFVSVGGAASGLFLWQFSPESIFLMILGGVLYGMFAMQIFGMSAAHANDYALADEFVSVNGGLLLIYGIGSVVGPSVAPVVMTFAGPSAMFAYTALIQFLLALYGIYRLTQRDAPKESNDYVAMPRPRAALLILRSDPRNLLRRKKRNKA